jgi:uracil phosphoribosyltransferase
MLATGKSLVKAVNGLLTQANPGHIHFVSVIAASEGVKYIQDNINAPHTIWTAALDDKLNSKSYIIPGLGDAGDLAYGQKI